MFYRNWFNFMKMILILLTTFTILCSPLSGEETALTFKIDGVAISKLNKHKIDKFTNHREILILDPHEKRKITFN